MFTALKAVTIDAAYQIGSEEKLGSISKGKRADFVILDSNPLDVPTSSLRDIVVRQTILNGDVVYKA